MYEHTCMHSKKRSPGGITEILQCRPGQSCEHRHGRRDKKEAFADTQAPTPWKHVGNGLRLYQTSCYRCLGFRKLSYTCSEKIRERGPEFVNPACSFTSLINDVSEEKIKERTFSNFISSLFPNSSFYIIPLSKIVHGLTFRVPPTVCLTCAWRLSFVDVMASV